jgi:hypothetical protein
MKSKIALPVRQNGFKKQNTKNNRMIVGKTTILTLLIIMLSSCSRNSDTIIPEVQLPPETQTGANTFGCIINNQVFYPRSGQGSLFVGGTRGLIFWGDHTVDQRLYNEIEIKNAKDGKPCEKMIIHLQSLAQIKEGEYSWQPSNFRNSIDGLMQNYVYAKIFDAASGTWKFYGSYENSGKVNITKYGNIISGKFSGKLRIYNGTEEIDVLQGRFDINSSTISTTPFP